MTNDHCALLGLTIGIGPLLDGDSSAHCDGIAPVPDATCDGAGTGEDGEDGLGSSGGGGVLGCLGCNSGGTPSGGLWLAGLVAFGLRRRR